LFSSSIFIYKKTTLPTDYTDEINVYKLKDIFSTEHSEMDEHTSSV